MSLRAAAALGGGTGNSGLAPFPAYVSGNWYAPYLSSAASPGVVGANTAIILTLQYFPQRVTITALMARIATASAGNAMLGLYAHNPVTGKPTGNVLASVTGLSTGVAGSISATLGTPVTLDPGFYWAASEMDNGAASFYTLPDAGITLASFVGSATGTDVVGVANLGWQATNTYPTFPDLTAASLTVAAGTQGAAISYRVA